MFVTLALHALDTRACHAPPMPKIRITYDGKLALTVSQAAQRYDLELASMRSALHRLAGQGLIAPLDEGLDARTPLYLATDLDRAMAARPGKGANLRRSAGGDQG